MKKRLLILMLLGACVMMLTGCDFLSKSSESSSVDVPTYTGTISLPEDTGSSYKPANTTTIPEGTAIDYINAALKAVGQEPSEVDKAEMEAIVAQILPVLNNSGITDAKIKALCEYVVNNATAVVQAFESVTVDPETGNVQLTPTVINTVKSVYNDVMNIIGKDSFGKLFYNGLVFALDMLNSNPEYAAVVAMVKPLVTDLGVTTFQTVTDIMVASLDKAINYVTATELIVVITICSQDEPSNGDIAYVVRYFRNLMSAVALSQEDCNKLVDATVNNATIKEFVLSTLDAYLGEMPEAVKTNITTLVTNLFTAVSTTLKASALPLQHFELAILDQIDEQFIADVKAKAAAIDTEEVDEESTALVSPATLDLIKFVLKNVFEAYDSLSSTDKLAVVAAIDAVPAYLEANNAAFSGILTAMGMEIVSNTVIQQMLGTKTEDVNTTKLIDALKAFANNTDGVETLMPVAVNYLFTKLPTSLPTILTLFAVGGGSDQPMPVE